MRICLYTGTALPKLGGQEAVVDALARQFQKLGHEPFVMAPRPRLPLRPNDASLPYPVIRHPRFYSTKFLVSWYRRWLRAAYLRHHFDVIHCHDVYPTGYLAALTNNDLRIPIVITSHGGDVREGNVRLSKPGMRPRFTRAVSDADALVSIGRFTEEGFRRLGANATKIVTIPNGVDLDPFREPAARPADLDARIVPAEYALFLGRLALRKGVDTLLQALAQVTPNGRVQLVIAGSGDERPAIEQMIDKLNLRDRVRLVGRVVGDLKTYLLQNALCTVMPSRGWEAFPLVVLESFAAGRPVIGSRIPGLEDLIAPDVTGLLFTDESAADLAGAL
ncbi:MAG TPA: glycosyltransferase family 4 protein, partial [Tepidisphaeraceae bacterium]|nr:glycosyltransferase family 4 protein [Tepidisphaeraceae bacterium]